METDGVQNNKKPEILNYGKTSLKHVITFFFLGQVNPFSSHGSRENTDDIKQAVSKLPGSA